MLSGVVGASPPSDLVKRLDALARAAEEDVIAWRHWFHENPELSNREYKTSERVAEVLREIGLRPKTGIAHTGVVAVLKGGLPGPVIALRADMDGLPVTERVSLPWASKVKTKYQGRETGVMHACGHDTHVAILLGVARVLKNIQEELPGTVKFVFQPAEEGAPPNEEGGAKLMVKEGVLKNPDVEAMFGLHINSRTPVGHIRVRPGGIMASANSYTLKVKGKQTHGSTPWTGIDPIVTSAQIINALQTIVSRNLPLTRNAAVVTVGSIHGGMRNNIIPEEVVIEGTLRALDDEMRETIFRRMHEVVDHVAASAGAEAELTIHDGVLVTHNDENLYEQMLPTLKEVAGESNVFLPDARTGAEDFSFYAKEVPALFYFLGGCPKDQDPAQSAPHHTPDFYVDDAGMLLGIRSMSRLAVDYLHLSKN